MTISFDLWGTLIKQNPEFKKAKNDLIRRYSAFPNKDVFNDYFIADQIKVIKRRHDEIVEAYGTQPDIKHLFAELCMIFSIPASELNDFYSEYQGEFIDNPPLLYSDDTLTYVKTLYEMGHKVVVSSNTLFSSPDAMEEILRKRNLDFIYGSRFSGSVGASKPNKEMFYADTDIHVGDNTKTDGACTKYGIKFFQINSNIKTIRDLYEYVSFR